MTYYLQDNEKVFLEDFKFFTEKLLPKMWDDDNYSKFPWIVRTREGAPFYVKSREGESDVNKNYTFLVQNISFVFNPVLDMKIKFFESAINLDNVLQRYYPEKNTQEFIERMSHLILFCLFSFISSNAMSIFNEQIENIANIRNIKKDLIPHCEYNFVELKVFESLNLKCQKLGVFVALVASNINMLKPGVNFNENLFDFYFKALLYRSEIWDLSSQKELKDHKAQFLFLKSCFMSGANKDAAIATIESFWQSLSTSELIEIQENFSNNAHLFVSNTLDGLENEALNKLPVKYARKLKENSWMWYVHEVNELFLSPWKNYIKDEKFVQEFKAVKVNFCRFLVNNSIVTSLPEFTKIMQTLTGNQVCGKDLLYWYQNNKKFSLEKSSGNIEVLEDLLRRNQLFGAEPVVAETWMFDFLMQLQEKTPSEYLNQFCINTINYNVQQICTNANSTVTQMTVEQFLAVDEKVLFLLKNYKSSITIETLAYVFSFVVGCYKGRQSLDSELNLHLQQTLADLYIEWLSEYCEQKMASSKSKSLSPFMFKILNKEFYVDGILKDRSLDFEMAQKLILDITMEKNIKSENKEFLDVDLNFKL